MTSAGATQLRRVLAIRPRAKRLAALRALLSSLKGDVRKQALAAIRELEALLDAPSQQRSPVKGRGWSAPAEADVDVDDAADDREMSFSLPTEESPASRLTPSIAQDRPPVVSLAISELAHPAVALLRSHTLVVRQPYYLWLEIGEPVVGAMNDRPAPLPVELLPTELELDVIVFAVGPRGDGFVVSKDGGRIRIAGNQSAVTRPASTPAVDDALLRRRLFFAITAPGTPGEYRLACHLYYQGTLIQSHDISAEVTANLEYREISTITARMDYVLSEHLRPSSLAGYGAHTLSVATSVHAGSHSFAFSSADCDLANDANFDGQEIQDLIDRARRAFRLVSWGSDGEWSPGMEYRYDGQTTIGQMTADLARLAIAGYLNYDAIIDRLGGDADVLAARMRAPGVIQLALKQSARLVLPIALIYDHRLDTDGDLASYTLCEQFSRATGELDNHPCFLGNCPHRQEGKRVICPSGFWGFRHEIGIPPTLAAGDSTPAQLPSLVACPGVPSLTVAVSMDPAMREREPHLRQLGALVAAGQLHVAQTRRDALELLRCSGAHLVYFYCHGGVDDNAPYLQIGAPGERIGRATLRLERIRWTDPRALVFINGCHTTALEPERAIDLVTGFVQTAGGSGVIGTEITVFEPLATRFAEVCLAALLSRATVGAAIRRARLALLKDWNPLGLLYVPFAMATLRLAPASERPRPQV